MSSPHPGEDAAVVVVSRDAAVRRRAVRSLARHGLSAVDVAHLDLVGEGSPGVGCVLVDPRQPELGPDPAARLQADPDLATRTVLLLDDAELRGLCRGRDLEPLLARIEVAAEPEPAATPEDATAADPPPGNLTPGETPVAADEPDGVVDPGAIHADVRAMLLAEQRRSDELAEQVAALAAELTEERRSHLTTVRRHAHEAARLQAGILRSRLEIESLRADLARAVGDRLSGAA